MSTSETDVTGTTEGDDLSALFHAKFEPDSYPLSVLREAREKGLTSSEGLANYLQLESLREQHFIRVFLVVIMVIVPVILIVLGIIFGQILTPHV